MPDISSSTSGFDFLESIIINVYSISGDDASLTNYLIDWSVDTSIFFKAYKILFESVTAFNIFFLI